MKPANNKRKCITKIFSRFGEIAFFVGLRFYHTLYIRKLLFTAVHQKTAFVLLTVHFKAVG